MDRGTANRPDRVAGSLRLIPMATGLILALMIVPHQAGALSIEPMEIVVRGHVAAIELTRRTPAWISTRNDIPEKQRAAFVDQHYRITLVVDAVEQGNSNEEENRSNFQAGACCTGRPSGRLSAISVKRRCRSGAMHCGCI